MSENFQIFKPAKWYRNIAIFCLVIFSVFFVCLIIPFPETVALLFYIFFYISFLGLCVLMLIGHNKTALIFKDRNLIYRTIFCADTTALINLSGLKSIFKFGIAEMKIDLDKIKDVSFDSRYFIIDIGDKTKKVIPNIFGRKDEIFSILSSKL